MDVLTLRGVSVAALCCAVWIPVSAEAQFCASDDFYCSSDDTLSWTADTGLFDSLGFDTGFVPGGSPVSLRVLLGVNSETRVSLTGGARATWPAPLTTTVLGGDPGTGALSIDHGFEFDVQLRIFLRVAGVTLVNETLSLFSIPDVIFQGTAPFDPFVYGAPVSITDDLGRFNLVSVPVLNLGVVSGNFALDVTANLTATYETNNIVLDGNRTLMSESDSGLVMPNQSGGFGAARDVTVQPNGTLAHDGVIELIPSLRIEFLGRTVASIDLGNVGVQALTESGGLVFPEATAHLPLPDVSAPNTTVAFGEVALGQTGVQSVAIENRGEADLLVDFSNFPSPFGADPTMVTIAPGATESVDMRFTPGALGTVSRFAIAQTNDPDQPTLLFRPRGEGVMPPDPDMGVADAGMPSVDAGVPTDAGLGTDGGGVILLDGAVVADAGSDVDAAIAAPGAGNLSGGACGCRVASRQSGGVPMALGLLVLGLAGWRRRRA